MASFVDEAVWAAQDWKWDAHNLTATPAEAPQAGKAARKGGDTATTKQGCQVRYARCRVCRAPGGLAWPLQLLGNHVWGRTAGRARRTRALQPVCPSADSWARPVHAVPRTVPPPVPPYHHALCSSRAWVYALPRLHFRLGVPLRSWGSCRRPRRAAHAPCQLPCAAAMLPAHVPQCCRTHCRLMSCSMLLPCRWMDAP